MIDIETQISECEHEIRELRAVPWNTCVADIAREYLAWWISRLSELKEQR